MILRFLGFLLWTELVCSNCICVNVNRSISRVKSHDIIQLMEVFLSVSSCAVRDHMWQVKEFKKINVLNTV